MVEVALLFPFFLAGLLLFIWIGVRFNARASLSAAISNAARLASTRGARTEADEKLVGEDLISVIDSWKSGTGSSDFEKLMKSPDIDYNTAMDFYDAYSVKIFGGETLDALPVTYTYTLAYINEALRMSLGGYVRYPCDPEDDGDPQDGAGCVGCTFLHPEYLNDAEFSGDPPERVIAIECKYQPSNSLLAPLQALIGIISGNANFTRILVKNRQLINMPQM